MKLGQFQSNKPLRIYSNTTRIAAMKLAALKPFQRVEFKATRCIGHNNGNVAICRGVFEAGFKADPNYTRVQFMKDCLTRGVEKTTSGKQWLPLGGPRMTSN